MKTQKKKFSNEFVSKALPILKEYQEEKLKATEEIKKSLSEKYNLSDNELVKMLNNRKGIAIHNIRAQNGLNAQ